MNPFPTRLPRSTRDRWSNRLLRTLLTLAVLIAGLVGPIAPARGRSDTPTSPTVTFGCVEPNAPEPCSVPVGGKIVTNETNFDCEFPLMVALINAATGARTDLGRATRTPGPCGRFGPDQFTLPPSITAGQYRVLAYQGSASEAFRSAESRSLLTVGAPTGFRVSGIAQCDDELLPEARVDLFSGTSLVDSMTAARVTAAFSFNVAPGAYTVRYTKGPIVCGGPTDAEGEPQPETLLDLNNESWPSAFEMALAGTTTQTAFAVQHLWKQDMSAWYRFRVQPGARVIVTLRGDEAGDGPLPANYDLTLYKDIAQAYEDLTNPQDLVQLQAEFAPDAFSPDAFSPDAFSPDAFSPDAFSPDAFSPDAFSPDAFSPDAFSPDAFSPDAFSPDAFSPDAFSPDAFSPDAFSPDAFSPDAFSPDAFSDEDVVSPEAFTSAQTRSLIAVSAFNGTAGEGVARNTWDNGSDFYVRVRGRNGAFSLAAPFRVDVTLLAGSCAEVTPITSGTGLSASGPGFRTLVLSDFSRLAGTAADKLGLTGQLQEFLAQPEVQGTVVDIGNDARIVAARTQSDAHNECPFAKNVMAGEIKRLIDSYRGANPGLEYVVFIGNDDVVPYYRQPDQAGLANEKNFVPPVLDTSASQASLKLGYVLTQDPYAARRSISRLDHSLPVPDLALGRLVETAGDAALMLDAYLDTTDSAGIVATPSSALVTGYDFLADAATAVAGVLGDSIGATNVDTLIQPGDQPPTSPTAWNATQLRTALLGERHDLVYLGGHFSQSSALAADFTTRMITTEVLASTVDLKNAIIFSPGCHSGYNTVDPHAVQGITPTPDWGQTFARKQATLIAGTGYQYGETEIIDYSERLYLEFSRALRTGPGPIAVGKALVAAKRAYLAGTPRMRGIHEKSYLEATLYGLPMLRVNMPGPRLTPPSQTPIVTQLQEFPDGTPGDELGLRHAPVSITPTLNEQTVRLRNTVTGQFVTPDAKYFTGANGVVMNPGEPALPLELRNASVPNMVLRGVGFRGGSYTDATNIRPLTGAPATELRTPRPPFGSGVFFPTQPWSVNYFDAVGGGPTHLAITPSQFLATPGAETGTRRRFTSMNFDLFYSSNLDAIPVRGHPGVFNRPGLSAAPAIAKVAGVPTGQTIEFTADVVGDPTVGIQQVWVTYTVLGATNPTWTSVDLVQATGPYSLSNPSSRWRGTLTLPSGQSTSNVRFIVQAVNGVGLTTLSTNLGAYYTPAPDEVPNNDPKDPTQVTLLSPPGGGDYREQVTVRARLTRNGTALANQTLSFGIGSGRRLATTNASGEAQTVMTLLHTPGAYDLVASFQETDTLLGSFDRRTFPIAKQDTELDLTATSQSAVTGGPTTYVATLRDTSPARRLLVFQTVLFVVTGPGGTYATASITDFLGRARLPSVPLPVGSYTVAAHFARTVVVNGQSVVMANDRYNGSFSRNLGLTLTADPTPPTCVVGRTGVDEDGRRFAEFTVQDTGAGLAGITATGANVHLSTGGLDALVFAMGTTSPLLVRATLLDSSQGTRPELALTDAAVPPNTTVCSANVGGRTRTITFDDLAGQDQVITGEYPAGVVNWGLNRWWHAGPFGQFTTKSLSLNGNKVPAPTSGDLSFVVPTGVVKLTAYNGDSRPTTVTLACSGNPTRTRVLAPGERATIETGWSVPCANMTLGAANGWSTNFDDLVVEPLELGSNHRLVIFDDRSGQDQPLNGVYPADVLNWGTSQWWHSSPYGAFNTKSASLAQGRTSGEIVLPTPRKLVSLQVHHGGATPTTLTLRCTGQADVVVQLAPGDTRTIAPPWTAPCARITVITPVGWDVNLDNILLE